MLKRLPKFLFTALIPCLLFFVNSCKTKDVSQTIKKSEITERLFNLDGTLVLELSFAKNLEPVKNYKFQVRDVATQKVIFSDQFRGTKLIWHTTNSLKGFLYVGVVQQENENPEEGDKTNTESFKIIQIKD